MPPLCGLHFIALGLRWTWYKHAPTCVLIIFAALTPCARSATKQCVGFDSVTLRYVLRCSLGRAFCHNDFVGLLYGRNA